MTERELAEQIAARLHAALDQAARANAFVPGVERGLATGKDEAVYRLTIDDGARIAAQEADAGRVTG